MKESWCFSCGAPVRGGGLAPLCDRCTQAGRQVDQGRLRWVVRTQDGGSRGPMGRDALVDQVIRGALKPDDRVARVGGSWSRLCEHADFRQYFLPGTEESKQLNADRKTEKREKAGYVNRQRLRMAGAGAFALAGVGLAVVSTQQGLFVLPEEQVEAARALFSQASEELGGQLEQAVDQDKAMEEAMVTREIPGDELITEVQERWKGVEGAPGQLLAQGHAALWEGTVSGAREAKDLFEKALALHPNDPEAAAGLARAAARLLYTDPSLANVMTVASTRAAMQAPGSPAALLAKSEAALANGARDVALDLASQCGKPADTAGLEGSGVDLACGVMVGTLGHKTAALEALDERYPGVDVIRLGLAEALLASQRFERADAMLRPLSNSMKGDSAPWRLRFRSAMATGDWDRALAAGKQVRSMDPDRLPIRRAYAEVLLKVAGDGRAALAEYEAILAHDNLETLPDRARLYTNAAAAALTAGEQERAVALADKALEMDRGAPGAIVQRARALHALGRQSEAQSTLRDVDLNRTVGNSGARYHTAAAEIFLENGLARQAVAELRGAMESDPTWPEAHLMSAQAKLLVGNLGGAIEDIEKVAYLDKVQDSRRTPLQEVWYPTRSWKNLRAELEKALVGDAMYSNRGPAALAVVAWYAGMGDRQRLMSRALEGGSNAPAAFAARAQDLVAAGRYQEAFSHAERVLSSGNDLTLINALKGRCLAAMGRLPEANAAFNKATDQPHKIAGVYRFIAETRRAQGDDKAATAALQELLKLAPTDLPAQRDLLELRNASG